jgi:hypothetical protein
MTTRLATWKLRDLASTLDATTATSGLRSGLAAGWDPRPASSRLARLPRRA